MPLAERVWPATVFVVVDDDRIRADLGELLASEGLTVVGYATCEAFLDAYRPGQVAYLLIDAYLPGTSGLELLKQLTDEGHMLPAIMITGRGAVSMAIKAMKAGASDFIEKPVGRDVLLVGRGLGGAVGGGLRRHGRGDDRLVGGALDDGVALRHDLDFDRGEHVDRRRLHAEAEEESGVNSAEHQPSDQPDPSPRRDDPGFAADRRVDHGRAPSPSIAVRAADGAGAAVRDACRSVRKAMRVIPLVARRSMISTTVP